MALNMVNVNKEINDLSKQSLRIGILKNMKGKLPNREAPLKNFTGGMKISRIKGQSDESLKKIALKNDKQYGLFSKALELASQTDLLNVIDEFATLNKTQVEIRRLENAGKSIIQNPLKRGDFGKNTFLTAKEKRFNLLGVDTGTMFFNIKAEYKKR